MDFFYFYRKESMKKTTGEAEPKHKESKDSVVLFCQNLTVSIVSIGCRYR